MKKAKLVYVSLLTRVIVEEETPLVNILDKVRPKLINKINNELYDNYEDIKDDLECPYDPKTDKGA